MQAEAKRIAILDAVLLGGGGVLLVPYLVIGIFFLRHLSGWQVWWGGELGGLGAFLFVWGVARVVRRKRVSTSFSSSRQTPSDSR